MRTAPATQPTLGLPTMNRHCEDVRRTVAEAKARYPKIPAEDLQRAMLYAETARKLLADVYRIVQEHHTLSVQAETTGKAARHLRDSIAARVTGQVPQ